MPNNGLPLQNPLIYGAQQPNGTISLRDLIALQIATKHLEVTERKPSEGNLTTAKETFQAAYRYADKFLEARNE